MLPSQILYETDITPIKIMNYILQFVRTQGRFGTCYVRLYRQLPEFRNYLAIISTLLRGTG